MRKVFFEISQNSQESTCTRAAFLIKSQAYKIPMNTFSTEHLQTTAEFLMANIIELFQNLPVVVFIYLKQKFQQISKNLNNL